MACADPWYAQIIDRYGLEYAKIAGYFEEDKPFSTTYAEHFNLPQDEVVVQFSGAFHPFHQGHLDSVLTAILTLQQWYRRLHTVIHVDHISYRGSKGECPDWRCDEGLGLVARLPGKVTIVREDDMPDGCSRNFTRLYGELCSRNQGKVYCVSGGDRANYALTFRDKGRCLISGRDGHPNYEKYRFLDKNDKDTTMFLPGTHPASSTQIRASL